VSGGITTTPQTFTITANASIGPVSVTPASGSGSSQTFQFVYTDSYGWNDLTSTWVYITGTFSSPLTNRCHMYSSGSSLYLLNDAGTAWMPGAIGSNATLQNSQCSLDLRNVSVTPSGNNLTLTVPIMFTSAFAGAKQVWMYAGSARGSTGWQQLGTWTVTAGSQLGSISPSTAIAGSGPTTLTANGSGFVGGASIRWTPANGSTAVLPATLVSSNQLQATVPASLLATAGTAQVAVASGGNITQSQTFTITASPEVASAVSVTPNSGSGASQAFQFLYSDSNGASALRT